MANTPISSITFPGLPDTYTFLHKDNLQYVTPEMYGAVGNGSADDSTALASAVASGKPVFLTQVYKAQLNITGNCELVGSQGSEIKGKVSVTGNAKIQGLKISQLSDSNYVVTVTNGNALIENCVIDGKNEVLTSCLHLSGCVNSIIKNCTVRNSQGRNGISVSSGTNIIIENCYVNNIYGPGIQTFDVCKNIKILNNTVYNVNIGVWTDADGSDGCISTYGDTTGTGTTPSENYEIVGNVVYNDNIEESNTGVGVRINGVKDCLFAHNYIYHPFFTGLLIQDRSHTSNDVTYVVKNDNVVIDSNQIITTGKNIASALVRGGGLIHIKNNVIRNISTESYQMDMMTFGIANSSASATEMLIIEGNRIETVVDGGRKQPFYFAYKPGKCIIRNNRLETGGGMHGDVGRLWLVSNIIHTTVHNYVVNLATDYAFVKGNIYSCKNTNGSFTITATSNIFNEDNVADGGMYAT